MEKLKQSTKFETRIDNIGYFVSLNRSVYFCCLIKKCGFKSQDLLALLYHVKSHSLEWSGFCHTCNKQIHKNRVQLVVEYKHMTRVHFNDTLDSGNDTTTKPAFIKLKLLPGDKLSKSKEVNSVAKYEKHKTIPSTSLPAQSKKNSSKRVAQTFWTIAATRSNSQTPGQSLILSNQSPGQSLIVANQSSGQSLIVANQSPGQSLILANQSHGQSLVLANIEGAQVSVNVNQLKEHILPSSFQATGAQSYFSKQGQIFSVNASVRSYVDSEIVLLKVWRTKRTLKTQQNCKLMLRYGSLYALYKCMDIDCSFTTDSTESMLIHLRNHELASDLNNHSNTPTWLECAYCDEVAGSRSLLIKHVQDEHKSSIFQCPHCFYRSCDSYNVVVHLNQFHPSEKMLVLVCNGKTKLFSTEKALIEKAREENIRPLRCEEGEACNRTFYVMDYFVNHMRSSSKHRNKFKCSFCGYDILISETVKHLRVHSVGVYECVYCRFGVNDVRSIQNHMCNAHPSKLLYICVRLTRKDQILTEDQISSVTSTLIFHLGKTVDRKIFQKCPFSHKKLSYMSPSIESNLNITDTSLALPSVGAHNQCFPPSTNESVANDRTVATSISGLELSDILSYKDLVKYYMFDDFDKHFATLGPPQLPMPLTSRRKKIRDEPSILSTPRTDLLQMQMDNAAYHLAKITGLEGRKLYRCNFENCYKESSDLLEYNVHLLQHNESKDGFKCYHCHVISKNIAGLKLHIQVHGNHRYFCYFCNYSSASVKDIQQHIYLRHNRNNVVKIPLNPKKRDQRKDMFVMCTERSQCDMNQFGINLIERYKEHFRVNAVTSTPCISSEADQTISTQLAFVPVGSRFICNVRNCHYRISNENMLKLHLIKFHAKEEQYKCPHCDTLICQKMDAEKVVSHLRMHNSKVNYRPNGITDHVESNVEKGEGEVDSGTISTISNTKDKTTLECVNSLGYHVEVPKWHCKMCNDIFSSQNLIEVHIQTVHGKKFQYQCGICSGLLSTTMANIQEHISVKHPDVVGGIKTYYRKVECANDNRVDNNTIQNNTNMMKTVSDQSVNAIETIGQSWTIEHLGLNNVPEDSSSLISNGNITDVSDKKILTPSVNLLTSKDSTTNKNQMKSPLVNSHAAQLPDAVKSEEFAVKSKLKLSDSIIFACYHCNFKSQNPTTTYNHWNESHKFRNFSNNRFEPSLQFMFQILRIFQCYYCRKSCFKDLQAHNEKYHPKETVAVVVDNSNPDKCGFCLHQFNNVDNEIINHFNENHKNVTNGALIEPDNYLTDEVLDEIVAVRPRKSYQCNYCIMNFSSMSDLSVHTKDKHPRITTKFGSASNSVMYGCSTCQKTDSNESAMVAHIREHFLQFQCKFCENRFNRVEMVQLHHEMMHNCGDKTYRNIDVTETLDKYLAMKIIFPNGLVLTKSEAKYTRYGAMDGVIKLVREINHNDLKRMRRRHGENENSVVEKRRKLNADNVIQVSPNFTNKENDFPAAS